MTDFADEVAESIERAIYTNGLMRSRAREWIAEAIRSEREECAKIADIWGDTKPVSGSQAPIVATIMSDTGLRIAKAIRERGDND
jgi:hypothetical protein